MKQSQIDELLNSSESESFDISKHEMKNTKKGFNKKKIQKKQQNYEQQYDDFFESEDKGVQKLNRGNKKTSQKEPNKLKKENKQEEYEYSFQDEQDKYLNSQDFRSQQENNQSAFKKQKNSFISKTKRIAQKKQTPAKLSKNDLKQQLSQSQQYDQSYQVQEQRNVQQLTPSKSYQSQQQNSHKQKGQQSEIVQSQYDQSQNLDEIQEINQNKLSQMNEGIENASQFLNDDEMSEAQSEFIESSRMDLKIGNKNNVKGHNNTSKFKSHNDKGENKQSNKKSGKTLNQQPSKKKQNIKNDKKNTATNIMKKSRPSTSGKQISEQQLKQRKTKLKQIEDQKRLLEQKKNKKLNAQKEKAKAQYEEMKQKQQERKAKNKQILIERKKKQKQGPATSTKIMGFQKEKIQEFREEQLKKKAQKVQMNTANELKIKRKKQEQGAKKKIQQQNRIKIKLLEQERHKKFELKPQKSNTKQVALQQKRYLQANQIANKKLQKRQEQTQQVKQLKKQLNYKKKQIDEKKLDIMNCEDMITKLKKKLKEKEKQIFTYNQQTENKKATQNDNIVHLDKEQNFSDLTSVQKFVSLFESCSTTEQIFSLIDQNKDGMLSIEEVKNKINSLVLAEHQYQNQTQKIITSQVGIQQLQNLSQEIYSLLDKNSDGNVTREQFAFIIDSQIKKIRQYRNVIGNLPQKNPLDIEAKILDMRQKIKYMDTKIKQEQQSNKMTLYEEKYNKLLAKVQEYQKKLMYKKGGLASQNDKKKDKMSNLGYNQNDIIYFLNQQVNTLSSKHKSEQKMLQKIRQKQAVNIKQKNLELCKKVQQNLRINQQIYKIKLQIQQLQLRYLSTKKISENRYRYQIKKSQERRQYQEAIQKAKQYQTKILNPMRQVKFGTYANEVQFLAAVIMIQRNFRKKKAMRQKENLQSNKTK